MTKRVAKNAGSFYPATKNEIENLIDMFNKALNKREDINEILKLKPKAIISPHAGYIYSGYTANVAHRVLANKDVKRVVVIGPSHHIYFKGVSGSFYDLYETPIKDMQIDVEYLNVIDKNFGIDFVPEAHYLEHSTETQMPFIANYQPNVKVIELIYGDDSLDKLTKIVTWLLEDSLTSVVISTDLSHFYTLEQAKSLDAICINGIANLDNSILDMGCEACGITGIKALNSTAKKLNLKSHILDYRTSADASGDIKKVVGYLSASYE